MEAKQTHENYSVIFEHPVHRKPSFRESYYPATGFPRISLLGNRVNSPVLCNPAALLQAPPPGCLWLGRGRRGLAQCLGKCAEDPIQCQPSMAHPGEKCFWVMRKPQGRTKERVRCGAPRQACGKMEGS